MYRTPLILAPLLILGIVAAGCGEDGDDDTADHVAPVGHPAPSAAPLRERARSGDAHVAPRPGGQEVLLVGTHTLEA